MGLYHVVKTSKLAKDEREYVNNKKMQRVQMTRVLYQHVGIVHDHVRVSTLAQSTERWKGTLPTLGKVLKVFYHRISHFPFG